MQSVARKNTAPERKLRELFHAAGFPTALYGDNLPGRPDCYFPDFGLVVFVHGCFWHGHRRCRKGLTLPKTNRAYWRRKIEGNRRRDARVERALRRSDFSVVTIWECEVRANVIPQRLLERLQSRRRTLQPHRKK